MEERRSFSRAEGIQHHMKGSNKKRGKRKKMYLPPTWKMGATLLGGSGSELAPDGPLRQGTWDHVKAAQPISSCPLRQLWGTGGV